MRLRPDSRDAAVSAFRERICEEMGVAPFWHQREVWCASDGLILTPQEGPSGLSVRVGEDTIKRFLTIPRPQGRARFLVDLGAFKIGKSWGAGLWASGFGIVPGSLVHLVGLEYDIAAPEFSYICEFLLSERGMGMKYSSLQNRPRDGKMWLDLANGARYEARSWERKDSLKGKEVDAYVYCEAYQLPGTECFTGLSQNLRARRGFAYFATTPDRPWIKDFHLLGHGEDPEWHCTCEVPAEANPYTFDLTAKVRDQKLMTREKYEIHYHGKLGDFVGRVFNYQRGTRTFSAGSHPHLFRDGDGRENLVVPSGWELVCGADTGTFYSALVVAFGPDGTALVLEEFPNYRYIGGSPERDESVAIPGWASVVSSRVRRLGGRSLYWADPNSQFRGELENYDMFLLKSKTPRETRTEITREYFEHERILLAPWLTVLPFELENACWPEEASAAGKFERIKDRDHTLDPLEHILSKRPIGRHWVDRKKKGTFAAEVFGKVKRAAGNVHLGRW